jgi:adapter protein MecA 1/2
MKIEKISDNQIRCTLNKSDLVDRELKISELAYGTEKAKALFRDMIQQAFYEFGFEVDDIPLVIEAIPVSAECLILVITKVEDPDELDTRFSKFSSFNVKDNSETTGEEYYADEIISNLGQSDDDISDDIDDNAKEDTAEDTEINDDGLSAKSVHIQSNLSKLYTFRSLQEVINLAYIMLGNYKGNNTLYKNPVNSTYYLVIYMSDHTPEEFNKICNIVSEFGKPERVTYASSSYFDEHFEIIIKDQALQILSVM